MADSKGQSEGQALLELQEKLDTCHVQIDMARMKQQRTVLSLRRAALTLEELKAFGGEVPMFKPVGKAYFLAPRSDMESALREDMAALEEEGKAAAATQERLVQEVAGVESDIRELLRSHPEAAAAYKQLVTAVR